MIRLEEIASVSSSWRSVESSDNVDEAVFLRRQTTGDFFVTATVPERPSGYFKIVPSFDVSVGYLIAFFRSEYGQLLLEKSANGGAVLSISLNGLRKILVPLPDPSRRRQIEQTVSAINRLELEVRRLGDEVGVNPTQGGLLEKLHSMLDAVHAVGEAERLNLLVFGGESKTVEFKQTFQYCLRRKQMEKDIETAALKGLVGFLNTDGGTLFIGVDDSGVSVGVGLELEKFHKSSTDKFLLRLKDRIEKRLGKAALSQVNARFIELSGNPVCAVTCPPSPEGVFLDGKDFYVRNSPSTDKLEGPDLANYLKRRF